MLFLWEDPEVPPDPVPRSAAVMRDEGGDNVETPVTLLGRVLMEPDCLHFKETLLVVDRRKSATRQRITLQGRTLSCLRRHNWHGIHRNVKQKIPWLVRILRSNQHQSA